jgi:hypothetical protein
MGVLTVGSGRAWPAAGRIGPLTGTYIRSSACLPGWPDSSRGCLCGQQLLSEGGLASRDQVGQRSNDVDAGTSAPGGSWDSAARVCVSAGMAAGIWRSSCPRRRTASASGSGWAAIRPAPPRRRHWAGWLPPAARVAAAWSAGRWGSGWWPGWLGGSRCGPRPAAAISTIWTPTFPAHRDDPAGDADAADLRAMFTAIGRQRPATSAPLSAATLARIRATLRAALNAAIREGLNFCQSGQAG